MSYDVPDEVIERLADALIPPVPYTDCVPGPWKTPSKESDLHVYPERRCTRPGQVGQRP